MLNNRKYTVYDGDGKVVIISCDKSICIAYAKSKKEYTL
jgi:hypothetical protein